MKIVGIGSSRVLPDEEYSQRVKIYEAASSHYSKYLTSVLGRRAARDMEKEMADLKSRDCCTDLDLENYRCMIDAVMTAFCSNKIQAAVKFTPECYKKNWSAEKRNSLVNYEIPRYGNDTVPFVGSISC